MGKIIEPNVSKCGFFHGFSHKMRGFMLFPLSPLMTLMKGQWAPARHITPALLTQRSSDRLGRFLNGKISKSYRNPNGFFNLVQIIPHLSQFDVYDIGLTKLPRFNLDFPIQIGCGKTSPTPKKSVNMLKRLG